MADKILLLEGLPWEEDEEYVSMKYDFLIKNFEIRNYSWHHSSLYSYFSP